MSPPPYGTSSYTEPGWIKPDSENEYGHGSKKVKAYIEDLEKDKKLYTDHSGSAGRPNDIVNAINTIQPQDLGGGGGSIPGAPSTAQVPGQEETTYSAGNNLYAALKAQIGSATAGTTPGQGGTGFVPAYTSFINSYHTVINSLYTNAGFADKAEQASQMPSATQNNTNTYNNNQTA